MSTPTPDSTKYEEHQCFSDTLIPERVVEVPLTGALCTYRVEQELWRSRDFDARSVMDARSLREKELSKLDLAIAVAMRRNGVVSQRTIQSPYKTGCDLVQMAVTFVRPNEHFRFPAPVYRIPVLPSHELAPLREELHVNMESTAFKRCPFCDSNEVGYGHYEVPLHNEYGGWRDQPVVECRRCGVQMPGEDHENARARWNFRSI